LNKENRDKIKDKIDKVNIKNDICLKNRAVYIDLFSEMSKNPSKYLKSDGMHWNKEGANLAANIIAGTLVDYMDRDGKIIPSSFP